MAEQTNKPSLTNKEIEEMYVELSTLRKEKEDCIKKTIKIQKELNEFKKRHTRLA